MSGRSRAAANLARDLSGEVGLAVRIDWDNPSGRPGRGAWRVEWTDGPTAATMRRHAEQLLRWHRPLTLSALRFHRGFSPAAFAAAMLTLAHRGELPDRPANAVGLAEHELIDTDTRDWAKLWPHARQLTHTANDDLYHIVALVHAAVTTPPHPTPPEPRRPACQRCAAPLTPARTGRPARYCGPACRQAAHRAHHIVTKPDDETRCVTCQRRFAPTGTGRPARHCGPACRTRAWRTRARAATTAPPPPTPQRPGRGTPAEPTPTHPTPPASDETA